MFFLLFALDAFKAPGDFPRRGERVGHIIYVFRQMEVTVALRCRMGKYSAQHSAIQRIPPAASQRSSASCLCVYSQAWSRSAGPRGGGAQSSGFTAGAKLCTSHDWSSGKKGRNDSSHHGGDWEVMTG